MSITITHRQKRSSIEPYSSDRSRNWVFPCTAHVLRVILPLYGLVESGVLWYQAYSWHHRQHMKTSKPFTIHSSVHVSVNTVVTNKSLETKPNRRHPNQQNAKNLEPTIPSHKRNTREEIRSQTWINNR